jgi:cytochrome o ubiquinol oxidase subunit 2
MLSQIRRVLFSVFILFTVVCLSGCHYALLQPKGIIAADEKNLLILATGLMLLVVIPVIALTYVVAWRYRESNQTAHYDPEWSHSNLIEVVCWSIPCIIILILGTITWRSSHTLDPYRPLSGYAAKPITIEAIALDWKWLFIYPEQGIATVNEINFPVGVPVDFKITAEGAMNSFMIPQLAGQIYAMAGMRTQLHLVADQPGDFTGMSANFSGDGFSDMTFAVHVGSAADFNTWVSAVKKSSNVLNFSQYAHLVQPSEKQPVTYFSKVTPELFDDVIMKSMMPMPMTDNNNAMQTQM